MKFAFALLCMISAMNTGEKALKIMGTVETRSGNYLTLRVEEVITYGDKIHVLPEEGTSITVRLPGQNPPERDSRVIIELIERPTAGESPTAYLMTKFETVR